MVGRKRKFDYVLLSSNLPVSFNNVDIADLMRKFYGTDWAGNASAIADSLAKYGFITVEVSHNPCFRGGRQRIYTKVLHVAR